MPSVLHPLLRIFARVTHHELARMVQYLKVENAILRSKLPKVVQVTPRERARLVKYGKALGDKIEAPDFHPVGQWRDPGQGLLVYGRSFGAPMDLP